MSAHDAGIEEILASVIDGLGPAKKFADRSSPTPVRLMAASGAMPLPPPQIATVLFVLAHDPETEVKQRAVQSLGTLPERVLHATLEAPVHPALLGYLAEAHREEPQVLEKIALNPATSDETCCFIATSPNARLVEIIAHNQTRLMRCPALLDALAENPVTSQATIDRILEFLGITVDSTEQTTEAIPDIPEPNADTADPDAEMFDLEDTKGLPDELLEESAEPPTGEEPEQTSQSLFATVASMGVMEKIKLARFGNGEARSILVRDRNKIVATAAINSPKLTETEVIAFAKSRSVSDDILRIIGNSRDLSKSRAVKHALVMNPKTPLPTAMKFINFLTDADLKQIMKSKDVPSQISTHARRILQKKGKV